jgi:hypothetical protein
MPAIETRECPVEIVDDDGHVAVAGAELVRVDAELVRELEPVPVTRQAQDR